MNTSKLSEKKVQSCLPRESFVPLFDIAEEYHFSALI